jgi:hypothetical protein
LNTPLEIDYGPMAYGETPSLVLLAAIDQDGDKKCKSIATGFISVAQPYVVLITAAHVFQGIEGRPVLAIGPIGSISLAKAKVVKSDLFDIAVAFLGNDDFLRLFQKCRCVMPEVVSGVTDSGVSAMYQLHGYPAAKNEISRTHGLKSHQVRVSLGVSRDLPLHSRFSDVDVTPFCFDISPKKLVNDALERDFRLGSFKGLSGGPVVRHSIRHGESPHANLIGMFVEWHKQSKTAVVVPWVEIERFVHLAVDF